MKMKLIHMTMLMATFVLAACHKETSVETRQGLAGNFTAVINGVQWMAADSTEAVSILDGLINITGVSADNKQLSITLNDTIPGVYTLNQSSTSLALYADNDSSGVYAFTTNQGTDTTQAGGIVTVIAIDRVNKTITGTFSFKTYRDYDQHQVTITQGNFYKLSYVTSLPPAANGDTINASIDGTNWSGQSITAAAVGSQLAISGSELNGTQAISLIMPLNVAPGSYPLDYTGGTYIGLYNPLSTSSFASSSGTLVILSNNPSTRQVSGNFQFLATDISGAGSTTHQVSNGYFDVRYNY